MSKFITGKKVREKLRPFEFFNEYIKRGLQPYSHSGEPIPPPDISLGIFYIESNLRNAKKELESKRRSIDPAEQAHIRSIKAAPIRGYFVDRPPYWNWKPPSPDEVAEIKEDILKIEKRVETLQKELSSMDYSWKNFSLPESTKKAEKILNDFDGYLYKVEEVEKKYRLPLPSNKTREHGLEHDGEGKKRKLRPVQRHKESARKAAAKAWEQNPKITIEDMISRDELHETFEGKSYGDKTLRNWIKDLCPDRSPGRRKETA